MTAKKNTARKSESTDLQTNPTQTQLVETLPAMLKEVNDGASKSMEIRLGGQENVLNAEYKCTDQKTVVAITKDFADNLFTGTALAYNIWAKRSATLGPILLKLWESYDFNVKEFNKLQTEKAKKIQPGQNWWIKRFFCPEFPASRGQVGVDPVNGEMGYTLFKTTIQGPDGPIEINPWNVIQELLRVGRNVREEKVRRLAKIESLRKEIEEKHVEEQLPELERLVEAKQREINELSNEKKETDDLDEQKTIVNRMQAIEKEKGEIIDKKVELTALVNTVTALESGYVPPKETPNRAARRTEDEMVKALSPRLLALSIQCQEDISGMLESQVIAYTREDGTVNRWSLRGILTEFFIEHNDGAQGKADLNAAVDYIYHSLDNLCKVAIGRAVKETCIELGTEKRPVFGLHEAVKKEGSDEAFYGKGQKYNDLMLNAKIIAKVEEPKADTAPTAPAAGKTA